MKLVIDTNVLISGLFFGGKPRELLNLLLQGKFESFISEKIVAEYQEIFDRMCTKYQVRSEGAILPLIVSKCKMTYPSKELTVCRDPDDNKFLECAVEAKCLYIVSGDNDLLSMKQFEDVEIITVTDLFSIWARTGS